MNDNITLLTLTLIFYLIMDPVGNIQSYLSLFKDTPPDRQKKIAWREMLIALGAMFFMYLCGEFFFSFLSLSEVAVRCAVGVIMFLIAIKILFPDQTSLRANLPAGEPFIIPLAIPLIAGPALLANILLFGHMEHCRPMMVTAILFSWMAACATLILAPQLNRVLGKNGLSAAEKLMGMVLVMLAIQRFFEGVQQLVAERG